MAELRRRYPERVEAKHRLYEQYAAGMTEVIYLSSNSEGDDGGAGDKGHGCLIGELTKSKWERIKNETNSE